ncbi:hypothetical protein Q7P37_009225 [Cladosporium fusiforme]
MSPPPQIKTIETRAEFDAAMECQWAGFSGTGESFWDVWFPSDIGAHKKQPDPRSEALVEMKSRMWEEHISDPHSTWTYISASDSDNPPLPRDIEQPDSVPAPVVLACCQWRIYPYPTVPFSPSMLDKVRCPAWPDGSVGAAFTTKLGQGSSLPGYNGWHVRIAMMNWGIERADEQSLEVFIEASHMGRPVYERAGCKTIRTLTLDMSKAKLEVESGEAAEEWQALRRYYMPEEDYTFHAMWRPVHGEWGRALETTWRDNHLKIWDAKALENGRFLVT